MSALLGLIVVAMAATFAYRAWRRDRLQQARARSTKRTRRRASTDVFDDQTTAQRVAEFVRLARRADKRGDVDDARILYQKAAYGFGSLDPEQIDALRAEVADFALRDPLYRKGVDLIRDYLIVHPGTLQSELGRQTGANREVFSYLAYYAEANGEIKRVRQGRSYRLYLPEQSVPPPSTKQRPRRNRRSEAAKTQELSADRSGKSDRS